MKRTRISVLLVIALLLQLCAPLTAGAADFTPNPQTEYAKRFIAACEGQAWFINEIERLLNAQQRTLDTITGAEDLVEIKSIGLKGQNRRLVILNAKEQIPRRMTGTRSIAFIFFTIKSPKAQGGRENEARFF